MEYENITREIIGSAIEVHKFLGPGLLESSYRDCMEYELKKREDYLLLKKNLFRLFIKK